MLKFDRLQYTEVGITLRSNEAFGMLDTGFLRDYYGVNNQLTVLQVATGQRFSLLLNEVIETSTSFPDVPLDTWRGFLNLALYADGVYQLEGTVRDVIGNYRILGSVENPRGD